MKIAAEMTFNEWFDLFLEKVRESGYKGEIEKYKFKRESGIPPEWAAKEFIERKKKSL